MCQIKCQFRTSIHWNGIFLAILIVIKKKKLPVMHSEIKNLFAIIYKEKWLSQRNHIAVNTRLSKICIENFNDMCDAQ